MANSIIDSSRCCGPPRLRRAVGFGSAERLRRCSRPSVLRTLSCGLRPRLWRAVGFGSAERLRRCPRPSVLRTLYGLTRLLRPLRLKPFCTASCAIIGS